ncbi:MAG: rhodanese-like domain-containing protein [Vicinamibacterales bacterium]
MTPADLAARIRAGTAPVVVDVRSPAEFAAGHVPGAINVPVWRCLFGGRPPAGGADPLVVYCGLGPRAQMAATFLRWRGIRDIVELDGHWAAWQAAGLPAARPGAPTR